MAYLSEAGLVQLIKEIKGADAQTLADAKDYAKVAFKSVEVENNTGILTFTKIDGTTVTLDTLLEKVVTNFKYDADTEKLVLTLEDGTKQEVALSAFIDVYTGTTNTETAVTVTNGENSKEIAVTLQDKGVTKAKLEDTLQTDIALVEKFTDETVDANLKFNAKEIAYKSDLPTEYAAEEITSLWNSTTI